MMFMRASSKAQQDKGKDLSVSIENLKAELSGLQWHSIARFNAACCGWASSCGQGGLVFAGLVQGFLSMRCQAANCAFVTCARNADERRLSLRLQQQLDDATLELQQRAVEFELGSSGAAAQRFEQELAELGALRTCNNELLAEVRSLQQQLKAKDFLLAAQKATAAAAADKAASAMRSMEEQVVLSLMMPMVYLQQVVVNWAGLGLVTAICLRRVTILSLPIDALLPLTPPSYCSFPLPLPRETKHTSNSRAWKTCLRSAAASQTNHFPVSSPPVVALTTRIRCRRATCPSPLPEVRSCSSSCTALWQMSGTSRCLSQ